MAGRACQEHDALRPAGGYARSKAAAEAACAAAHDAGRRSACSDRSPWSDPASAPTWPSTTGSAALERRPIEVFGGLHRSRDVTDVRAVVAAIAQLVDLATSGGRPARTSSTSAPVAPGPSTSCSMPCSAPSAGRSTSG